MDLKQARQIRRLTQQQLAHRSGVDISTISLIENAKRDYGRVGYADVVRLARALDVDAELLFPVPESETVTKTATR